MSPTELDRLLCFGLSLVAAAATAAAWLESELEAARAHVDWGQEAGWVGALEV